MIEHLINETFDLLDEVVFEVLPIEFADPELLTEGISFLTNDFVLDSMLLGLL